MNKVIQGNCLEVLKTLPDNSVDSIITDPPYEIGFMGKKWDSTGIAYNVKLWKECLRVLKPGGHILAFGGTRTYHRMACAIEDAGFEVRDQIQWIYSTGFPKSFNIGKAVDKLQGGERIPYEREDFVKRSNKIEQRKSQCICGEKGKYTKGTSEWEGWGTALKPAHEPICMARKPLAEKTVAENVLKWGTGGINIDECRIVCTDKSKFPEGIYDQNTDIKWRANKRNKDNYPDGRFPANVIHDGSDEVEKCFPNVGKSTGGRIGNKGSPLNMTGNNYEKGDPGYGDSGSASRFFQHCPITKEDLEYNRIFYGSKASKRERNMGLDKLVIISIMKIWKENNIIKEKELAQLLMDTDILRKRDIEEFGIQNKKGLEWNTVLFGKDLMEKYQRDVVSIIGTEINSITPLKIWNWLNFLLTKEYTLDVKYEMENGGNPVANAENYKPLIITINEKMASRLGVKNVVEGTQLKISVKDGSNIHPTCKSLSLMRYLCRLITPPKGIVLDMFAGSGSTLIAAKQEGFNYIGIEREEDYIKIAEARLKATPTPML
jgi:site-specific DNA-methyltransferase (adenine-specific)